VSMAKKFIPKVEKKQKKRNFGGVIFRIVLAADKKTVEEQQKWYRKRKIWTRILNPKKDVYELWVNER
jgi:hypothetical protein